MKWIISFVITIILTSHAEARRHYNYYSTQTQQHRQLDYQQFYFNNQRYATRHRTATKRRTARRNRTPHWVDPNGNMVQVMTVQGFKLTVHPAFAGKFTKFFALLEEHGFKPPKDMVGCYSRAHKRGSNHAIGAACDIQTGWNRTASFMYKDAKPLIKQAGLYDGCDFGDCGHVEAIRGLYNKAPNLYASLEKFKAEQSTANYQP